MPNRNRGQRPFFEDGRYIRDCATTTDIILQAMRNATPEPAQNAGTHVMVSTLISLVFLIWCLHLRANYLQLVGTQEFETLAQCWMGDTAASDVGGQMVHSADYMLGPWTELFALTPRAGPPIPTIQLAGIFKTCVIGLTKA